MPERTFNVLKTLHTSYTVTDLDKTVAFFRDCFGFDVRVGADQGGSYMEDITGCEDAKMKCMIVNCPDGHQLELFQYLQPENRQHHAPRPCDTGASHMAFMVDDFDAALSSCAEYDFTPINKKPTAHLPDGREIRTVYLRNEDGLMLEIIQPVKGTV